MQTETVDFEAMKERQRIGWEAGDYPRVGNTLQLIAELLVEAADVRAGQRVLDVACGQGNAAIAGARCFAEAVDYATNLLAQGRERAEAEHLSVTPTDGDAERLPFPDGAFDTTLSTVGVMFAPDQERAAAELVRVTRVGGKIALASWMPDGLVGALFKTIGKYAPPPPPPAGVKSPMLWGTEGRLADLFGDKIEWVSLAKRTFEFCYRSPEHFSEWFRLYYGPSPDWPERSMMAHALGAQPISPTCRGSSTAPTTAPCVHRASRAVAEAARCLEPALQARALAALVALASAARLNDPGRTSGTHDD